MLVGIRKTIDWYKNMSLSGHFILSGVLFLLMMIVFLLTS